MTSIVDLLMKTPKKDKGQEQPHTPRHYPKDYKQQIDLLYLPHDNKKKYALVVVDVGTRICDAQPMQDRKPKHPGIGGHLQTRNPEPSLHVVF